LRIYLRVMRLALAHRDSQKGQGAAEMPSSAVSGRHGEAAEQQRRRRRIGTGFRARVAAIRRAAPSSASLIQVKPFGAAIGDGCPSRQEGPEHAG
jgi:hypothetical protein